jgi:hypothetical protein
VGAYDNRKEEEQASTELDGPYPQEKKKCGRKTKTMNIYDSTFIERLVDLARYYTANDNTNVHRDYTTAECYNLGNWLREQRKNMTVENYWTHELTSLYSSTLTSRSSGMSPATAILWGLILQQFTIPTFAFVEKTWTY